MACPRRTRRMVAAVALLLAFTRQAVGQVPENDGAERVRVELSVPDKCAQRERFFEQVRQRLGNAWEAAPGELARTIHVRVTFDGARYIARIELTDARGRQVVRAVAGSECEQVIDGIALITVLAIQAQVDELISRSEPSEPPAPETGPVGPAGTAPAKPAHSPAAQAPRPNPPPSTGPAAWTLRVGGRAGIQQGVGPGLAPIYGGFIGLAWERLVLALSLDVVRTGEVQAEGVPAEFELWAGRLEACKRVRPTSESLTIEPCLFVQVGNLTAEGIRALPQVSRGGRGSTTWLAPGLLLAMRGELGPVFLGLEAAAGISLDQETFYLDVEGAERRTVHQVPWLTTSAALTAGVAF